MTPSLQTCGVFVEIAGCVAGEVVGGLQPAMHRRHGEQGCGLNTGLGFEVIDDLEAFGELHFVRGIVGLETELGHGGVGGDEAGGFAQITAQGAGHEQRGVDEDQAEGDLGGNDPAAEAAGFAHGVELLEIESGSGAGGAPCGPESGERCGGDGENGREESDGRAELEAEERRVRRRA